MAAATSPPIPFYRQLVEDYQNQYESLIQNGEAKPVLLWHLIALLLLPVLALLVSRRKGGRYVQLFVLACLFGALVHFLRHRRMLLGGYGYMGGLLPTWWFIWCAVWLAYRNAERDCRRIIRTNTLEPTANGSPTTKIDSKNATEDKRHDFCPQGVERLAWQSYPQSLSQRLDWVFSLLYGMRGPEWNWRISSLGPLPASIHAQLKAKDPSFHEIEMTPAEKTRAHVALRARVRSALVVCIKSYLALDLIKLLMIRDTYFMYNGTMALAPPYPFTFLTAVPGMVRFYRLAVTGFGVHAALTFVTSFNPIIFGGLALAFPNAARALTSVPLDAPWLYAETFGPFLPSLLDHGLIGCWSKWWHQLFRVGFTSTGRWLVSFLPADLASRPAVRQLVYTFVAFGLSGLVHSSGSYVQIAVTRPAAGPFRFFILQAVGFVLQGVGTHVLVPCLMGAKRDLPQWLRRTANLVFAIGWLYLTAPVIADDFARGGLWLTEPLPVSPLRGLGIGVREEDKGWWCWSSPWFEFWDDGTYWGSGVRVI
ncbi:wax synthase family protein [Aspergillus saccharolyticus JOP 1030-1]|uniref:Wax synthase domain-containing protein n=1 Tax=Aspergillus saccharolyticus JOP 1030-1 TaxID=1450539 RepID=A0A318Z6J8_9EURO|nr:hypothetical protein BP01DRAFT_359818 [Aspergillus saccharolyticus JOP 1030-1]PYH42027.1 hypothetical protein BP01DRAFT_359818 [Aspergillus saccharolyticus JOP 1030-1]